MSQLIDLGKLRFFFAGEYDATHQYEQNDVVKYGGNVYVYTFTLATVGTLPTTTSHWKLMLEGLKFQGVYSSAKSYRIGDGVAYGGTVYVAIADSTNILPTDSTKWSTFLNGIQFEGVYSSGTAYQLNDVVTYGSGTYVAKKDTLGNLPSNTNFWTAFISGVAAQGVYNAATSYVAGDLVAYGGYIYRAIGDTTGNDPSLDTYWAPFLAGLNDRGTWLSTGAYRIGDLVRFGGVTYRAIRINVPVGTLPTDATNYVRFLDTVSLRGPWAASTQYFPNDLVTRGGSTYLSTSYHASGTTFATDLGGGKWSKYNGGIRFRGTYQKSTAYLTDDVVIDGLNTYIATADFTSDTQDAIYQTALTVLAKGADYLPGQAGKAGLYLKTDGTAAFWAPASDIFTIITGATLVPALGGAYFVDTNLTAYTLTLPAAPAAYCRVRIVDYAGSFDRNRLLISRNGQRIMGQPDDMVADVRNASFELLYSGATYGWKVV